MKTRKKTTGKKTTVKEKAVNFSGDLTISRCDEILSQLREAFDHGKSVRISLQEVTAIDLSFLQLLCAAHRTAAAEKKEISIELPVPDLFRQSVRDAGFRRRDGCAHSNGTTCLCN